MPESIEKSVQFFGAPWLTSNRLFIDFWTPKGSKKAPKMDPKIDQKTIPSTSGLSEGPLKGPRTLPDAPRTLQNPIMDAFLIDLAMIWGMIFIRYFSLSLN